MSVKLRVFQEEMRRLIFPGAGRPEKSVLWGKDLPDRLGVYKNNTAANWVGTLDSDFPLTRGQFEAGEWERLGARFFLKHPASHWELNASLAPFTNFFSREKVKPYVKELADYEWHDLKIFIDRATVKKGLGVTNPTAVVRVYQHQIFFWVEAKTPKTKPPRQKPEVLVFFRDSQNTSHIMEADPLMILLLEHFKKPRARLEDLEPLRRKMLPQNQVPLEAALESLKEKELILV